MTTCPTCTGIQSGHRSSCPACGRGLAFYIATHDEIAAACAAIQATWSVRLEAARARKPEDGWTVPVAVEVTDHRRRKKERD